MSLNYRFLGIDEGKKNLLKADTASSRVQWLVSLSDYPQSRDMQRLNNETVLIGYENGYFVCEISTGKILHICDEWNSVTSVRRLSDGNTLVTGLDLAGEEGVCVLTLDKHDKIVEKRTRTGDYVRLMRPGSGDSFLFCTNDHIIETDLQLKEIRRFASEGFLHAWKPMVLTTGDILISAGYGAFMARFTSNAELLQTFGRKEDLPEEIEPNFYASFAIAEDGNILVANWQGHGPDNGQKGRQLICFTSEGEYLESWSFPDDISSLQGLLLLSD